jgi:hypothetical protein
MTRGIGVALTSLGLVAMLTMTVTCSASAASVATRHRAARAEPAYPQAATLSGPVTVGHIIEPAFSGTLPAGYVEQEYFASGTASAFEATSEPADGRWSVVRVSSASYRTRIVVRRPAKPSRFNGTVVVEWLNESVGESSPDWAYLNPYLSNAGFAYVGVSVQALGVEGGKPLLSTSPSQGLVQEEPARYGTLHQPGDQYSFDIFAQVGRALREGEDHAVLGHLHPEHIVAVGESQSAFFLTTFANVFQPLTHAYDGLFIHSRNGPGASLGGTTGKSSGSPAAQHIRTDLDVPVFMFETETDATKLGFTTALQPDTKRIRTWEVAGTSHIDAYLLGGTASGLGCTQPINNGPQHVVVQAAFSAFSKWVSHGTPPPSPGYFALASSQPVQLTRDADGNVVGGVRSPAVQVPVSVLSGVPASGTSGLCSLLGSTTSFTPARLVQLYHSKANYLALYTKSLDRAIAAGYILPANRASLVQQAEAVAF